MCELAGEVLDHYDLAEIIPEGSDMPIPENFRETLAYQGAS
jgi:hypothetical protein